MLFKVGAPSRQYGNDYLFSWCSCLCGETEGGEERGRAVNEGELSRRAAVRSARLSSACCGLAFVSSNVAGCYYCIDGMDGGDDEYLDVIQPCVSSSLGLSSHGCYMFIYFRCGKMK